MNTLTPGLFSPVNVEPRIAVHINVGVPAAIHIHSDLLLRVVIEFQFIPAILRKSSFAVPPADNFVIWQRMNTRCPNCPFVLMMLSS